ncbi:MAG TPA: hypothetical protein VML75_14945 [Kofleriaceae bacterium]|nr:hypothetical protein [Kofleriaceae bacterium]
MKTTTVNKRIKVTGVDEDDLADKVDTIVRLLGQCAGSILGIEWLRGMARTASIVYQVPVESS